MTQQLELNLGRIYFGLAYEDDGLRYPIVQTYEYLGRSGDPSELHIFRLLGSGDTLELGEGQLDLVLNTNGLTRMLLRWEKENPSLHG